MKPFLKLLRLGAMAFFGMIALGVLFTAGAYLYLAPGLPSIETLKDVRLQVPLRIYTSDGALIAEYGEMKRSPLKYSETPDYMLKAVLAAEDNRFFEHPGVDYQGILRAVAHLLRTGEKAQGGSTITMQVARNFFLSREKTYVRKLNEIFLALKIERELTKEEILELYLNKIYLGNRAYGIAAAAQVYYGTDIHNLNLAQIAMIAGLPKAPSRYNPIADPERAELRRNYVLGRMHTLGFISDEEYEDARTAPVTASLHAQSVEVEAPYVAEVVRSAMVERFGETAYTAGYKVYSTVDSRLQRAANRALRSALLDYDRRHGYRGAEAHVDLGKESDLEVWKKALEGRRTVGGLVPGLVLAVEERAAVVYSADGDWVRLDWPGLAKMRPYVNVNQMGPAPTQASDVLSVGDIVRLERLGDGSWQLAQLPEAAGALVSLRPSDGAVLALVGGFDFYQSKFNRVIQGERQPGSNFKPFIYSAGLAKGFTAASIINDAPVVFEDSALENVWRPENYSGHFFGPTRLREALVHSRNLVSIRLLRSIGVNFALKHVARFGFDVARLPRDLSLALGSGSVSPLELARGYAVFANGGHLIDPYFIQRVEDSEGQVVFKADPPVVCDECAETATPVAAQPADDVASGEPVGAGAEHVPPAPRIAPRVLNRQNVYLMTSMLRDVIRRGTGRRALQLGRKDLAGKTGTTNDQKDAWFSGFNQDIVTTAWVGFDIPHPLGARETGARAALPMWVDFMREALRGVPERPLEQPPGLVTVRIDPVTGRLAGAGTPDAIFETFRVGHVPEASEATQPVKGTEGDGGGGVADQLF